MRSVIVCFIFPVAGCDSEQNSKTSGVLTVATVGGIVLLGHSRALGTSGSFAIQSVYGRTLSCEGKFRYPRPPDGTGYFSCCDGRSGSVRFKPMAC